MFKSFLDSNRPDDKENLGAEKDDFTTNQAEAHLSPRLVAPQPEMHFGLLDGVNSLLDEDCWGVCTDTDLERDIVIDNTLLPRHVRLFFKAPCLFWNTVEAQHWLLKLWAVY